MSLEAIVSDELATLSELGVTPFDVHSHTGVDIDGSERTAEEHAEALSAMGGRGVIFPLCVTTGYEPENRRVVAECERHADTLVPFARLDPRVSGVADARAALAAGARGFKLHPRAEDFRLEHPSVDEIAGVAADARIPVLVHAGAGVGSLGPAIVELANRHRFCPLILAHAGVSDLAWLGPVAAEHPNIYFDTSWWNPSDLIALFTAVPPGQILFGSDEPYMDLQLVLAVALRCARFAGLSDDAMRLVFGGQAEALLRGEPPIDAGPVPGSSCLVVPAGTARLAILLAAGGGAMLGGGDPTPMLELARVAVGEGGTEGEGAASWEVAELIEQALAGAPEAPWAVAMALTLVMTPGVGQPAMSG